jgi:uncharacterized protein YbaR (Trm112 family)
MTISDELLEILACPKCNGPIELTSGGDRLACSVCRLLYPIRDRIPVMLIEEAERISVN